MSTTAHSEGARTFYQRRLALMYQVGFSISATFLLVVVVVRGFIGQGYRSELDSPSRWFHIGATAITGALFVVFRKAQIGPRALEVMDAAGIVGLCLLLNLNAGLFDHRVVSVFNLVLTTGLAAMLRAVIVPSTASRTLMVGLVLSAVASVVFFASALHPAWPVHQTAHEEWPLGFQTISLVMWLGSLIATSVVASKVIYGLRHEVRAARKLGQYVLGTKLGEGGMGAVYRATHSMLRRETAIKLLPPDRVDPAAIRRFEREVVATARLRHPNTVAIFDYGHTPDGVFYYAMEYLDGLTIGDLVASEGPLPPGRVVHLLAQVCASLEEAHAMGLVHRDIKPANIMVIGHTAAYDLVKVLDFGLVKTKAAPVGVDELGVSVDVSREGAGDHRLVGTPLYMAPEAIRDPDLAEPRSDLYAVAAVGYFMLSGRHVFEGQSLLEICAAHLHSAPRPLREVAAQAVPGDLEALILRTLAKSPADRPANAASLREALMACSAVPWSQEDARGWWRTHGARALRPSSTPSGAVDLKHAPTISVALDRAELGESSR